MKSEVMKSQKCNKGAKVVPRFPLLIPIGASLACILGSMYFAYRHNQKLDSVVSSERMAQRRSNESNHYLFYPDRYLPSFHTEHISCTKKEEKGTKPEMTKEL